MAPKAAIASVSLKGVTRLEILQSRIRAWRVPKMIVSGLSRRFVPISSADISSPCIGSARDQR
jgi:hypothetical protein